MPLHIFSPQPYASYTKDWKRKKIIYLIQKILSALQGRVDKYLYKVRLFETSNKEGFL
jgi:hypothetical protein